MDVVASLYGRNSILSAVRTAAERIFVPLTVGGGIRSIDNIVAALRSGADKVAINTQAIHDPTFLAEAARTFGSQCLTLSVEAKRRKDGRWEALTDNGREKSGLDVIEWVERAEQLGVGEILLTSVDAEGTQEGFDVELIHSVRERVSIPVIGCGGAGNEGHVATMIENSGCDAVSCASIFHYGLCDIVSVKNALAARGIEVRSSDGAPVDGHAI
jgi:cyclase